MGTCFVRTLEFSHDSHAAHNTNNALFKTSVGRVFDFIDNRLFQLFEQFGFRNRWVQVFFFLGGKPTHIQKSKQLPVLVISNPPGCRKEPEKDGQFFSGQLLELFENHDYKLHMCSRVFDSLRMAGTNFRTALIPGGGSVQLLIPARQCNCPLPVGITISESLFVDSFPMIPRRYIMDTHWVSWVFF